MEQEIWQSIGRAFSELRDAFLPGEFQGMNSKIDKIDRKLADAVDKLNNTEALVRREFQRVFQRIGSRMNNVDRKLDNTAQKAERTEAFLRQESQKVASRMDNTDDKLDSAAQSLERTETFLRQESQRLGSRMDKTDGKLETTAQKLDKAQTFMEQESRRMTFRMDNTDEKLSSTAQKIDVMDSRITNLDATMRNSKILYITQKIHPLPAYDIFTQQPLPIPKEFPSTALKLYNLQYNKNCLHSHSNSFIDLG